MDHIPYPLTSDLPPLEIPLLCRPEQLDVSCSNEAALPGLQDSEPSAHHTTSSHAYHDTPEAGPSMRGAQGSAIPGTVGANVRATIETLGVGGEWTTAFWRYPKEQCWVSNDAESRWFLCSNKVAAARAQEWLYFRLLVGFLGVPVPAREVLKTNTLDGETVIDSSILPQLLRDWQSRIRNNGGSYTQSNIDRVLSVLTNVLKECSNLNEKLEPSRSISFSIKLLVETLAMSVWPLSKDTSVDQWTIWKLGPEPLLGDRMAGAGWCRSQVAKLWYQYLPSTLYYLASLPRRTTFGGVVHRNCTADHCTSSTVDPVTYQPSHRKTCITGAADSVHCSMVDVDTACIADIILQDSYPLIEIQVTGERNIELKVHKYELNLRYVAISHVWSGGLGNAKANSMRSCQLSYLHDLLHRLRENDDDDLGRRQGSRKIDDSIDDLRVHLGFARKDVPLLLWIDTLCVPVGIEHTVAYTKTLHRMAQIYITAQCTLVLDPELQNMDHRPMPAEQTYAHILSSSWMSRSWTFQEASMSRIWFVQFADGYFAVDKHYMELQKLFGKLKGELEASKPSAQLSASPPTPASILGVQSLWLIHDLTRWFREMPVLAKIRHGDPRELMSKLDDWQNVALAWNGLRDRSTTKAEDLYGIIAVVVDLSAGEILKLQHEERLKAIFRSQNTLPLPLLYQTGPRLLDNNGQITWAPAGIVGDRLALHSGYVTVSTEGLSIEPRRWVNMNWPQAVLFAPSQIYSRYLDIELNATGTRRTIELGSDPTYLKPQSPERLLCCIYDDTLIRHDISTFAPGVCLTIESQDHAVYSASYMCPIKVFACSAAVPDFAVGHPIRSNTKLVSGSVLDWKKHVIIVKSNFAHWPPALPHVSKRSLSKKVIIRNASNWIELSTVGMLSGPYIIGFIICTVRRRDPVKDKLMWLCLSRWLSLLVEAAWAAASLAYWDLHRTVDWTDRLYGTTKRTRLQHLTHLVQYPAFLARLPPLAAASAFLALYKSSREPWMKVFAIILFSEVGLSLAFTFLVLSSMLLTISHGWFQPMTATFFADLPEDPNDTLDSQYEYLGKKWSSDEDHRYKIAIIVWQIVDFMRRKKRTGKRTDRMVELR